jgi:GT2 family glycosyltransferase
MDITAVLVNYNDRRHLGPCLTALRAEVGDGGEIIVVDNASMDGSRDWLAAEFPRVRVIANAENRGFGAANNRGLAAATGTLILFLNTDTVVRPGAIRRLAETLAGNPEAAAAGPALVHPDGSFQVSFGKTVSFPGQFVQKLVLNPFYKRVLPRRDAPREVGWLSAACLLARMDAVRGVGGFDERFFLYFEDIDLCRRLAASGARLIFEPRAVVMHEGGATMAGRARVSRFEYRRSQLYFYSRHASGASRFFLRLYLRAAVAGTAARGGFRGEDGRALRDRYRHLFRKGSGAA